VNGRGKTMGIRTFGRNILKSQKRVKAELKNELKNPLLKNT
jgi:hypothetical protein